VHKVGKKAALLTGVALSLSGCLGSEGALNVPFLASTSAATSVARYETTQGNVATGPSALPGAADSFNGSGNFDAANTPNSASNANSSETPNSSGVIGDLQSRRSVLNSGAYAEVALAVSRTSSGAAVSELRAARLRSEAADKNWLPTLGPSVSLSSLGDVVAGLVLDQVLWDNGRKKAERAFARADVEVAAVNLSLDVNGRLFSALSLYLAAEEARAQQVDLVSSLVQMREFDRIVSGRVAGGIAPLSNQTVSRAKLAELKAMYQAAIDAERSSFAELAAMAGGDLSRLSGLAPLAQPAPQLQPLSVLRAQAEARRAVSEATMARAGFLPGLSARGTLSNEGNSAGLNIGSERGFGFGTGASLNAIKASRDAAEARVSQAREDAARQISRLREAENADLRQARDADQSARRTRVTLGQFRDQFEAGQRSVMDVIALHEKLVSQEQNAIRLRFKAALAALETANILGVLAEGAAL
jgi:outer membrane protein, adhesin transport system